MSKWRGKCYVHKGGDVYVLFKDLQAVYKSLRRKNKKGEIYKNEYELKASKRIANILGKPHQVGAVL